MATKTQAPAAAAAAVADAGAAARDVPVEVETESSESEEDNAEAPEAQGSGMKPKPKPKPGGKRKLTRSQATGDTHDRKRRKSAQVLSGKGASSAPASVSIADGPGGGDANQDADADADADADGSVKMTKNPCSVCHRGFASRKQHQAHRAKCAELYAVRSAPRAIWTGPRATSGSGRAVHGSKRATDGGTPSGDNPGVTRLRAIWSGPRATSGSGRAVHASKRAVDGDTPSGDNPGVTRSRATSQAKGKTNTDKKLNDDDGKEGDADQRRRALEKMEQRRIKREPRLEARRRERAALVPPERVAELMLMSDAQLERLSRSKNRKDPRPEVAWAQVELDRRRAVAAQVLARVASAGGAVIPVDIAANVMKANEALEEKLLAEHNKLEAKMYAHFDKVVADMDLRMNLDRKELAKELGRQVDNAHVQQNMLAKELTGKVEQVSVAHNRLATGQDQIVTVLAALQENQRLYQDGQREQERQRKEDNRLYQEAQREHERQRKEDKHVEERRHQEETRRTEALIALLSSGRTSAPAAPFSPTVRSYAATIPPVASASTSAAAPRPVDIVASPATQPTTQPATGVPLPPQAPTPSAGAVTPAPSHFPAFASPYVEFRPRESTPCTVPPGMVSSRVVRAVASPISSAAAGGDVQTVDLRSPRSEPLRSPNGLRSERLRSPNPSGRDDDADRLSSPNASGRDDDASDVDVAGPTVVSPYTTTRPRAPPAAAAAAAIVSDGKLAGKHVSVPAAAAAGAVSGVCSSGASFGLHSSVPLMPFHPVRPFGDHATNGTTAAAEVSRATPPPSDQPTPQFRSVTFGSAHFGAAPFLAGHTRSTPLTVARSNTVGTSAVNRRPPMAADPYAFPASDAPAAPIRPSFRNQSSRGKKTVARRGLGSAVGTPAEAANAGLRVRLDRILSDKLS
jgi:hypothetical protein